MPKDEIVLGAVAYDPKVATIWEGFKVWFAEQGLSFDYILYSNYERQVESHFAGHFDVAWNSPLAWIEAERLGKIKSRPVKAIAMRDTDQDLTSLVCVKADSDIKTVADLAGKTIAVGATDSPQATLIPLAHLAEQGLDLDSGTIKRFEVGFGLHGDHIGGERDAAKALIAGEADAACMIDGNHLLFSQEGTLPNDSTRVVTQTAPYDHCNFTIFEDCDAPIDRFTELLMGMAYSDPKVRHLLDLEGLKQWKTGRVSGYELLNKAVDRFNYLDRWLEKVG